MTATPRIEAPIFCVQLYRDGTRTVLVDCPFCGGTHQHGWGWGEDEPGHRLSHCQSGGYFIPGTEVRSS